MINDKKNTCPEHGYTLFKWRHYKDKEWWVCHKCLQAQWRRAQDKRRDKRGYKKYHRQYSSELHKIRKCLSVFLTMILLAGNIKPE